MVPLRGIVRNFLSVSSMRLALALLSFGFFVFLSRRWAGEDVGAFVTINTLFLLLQVTPLLGLNVPLVRDIAQAPQRLGELAGSALLVGLFAALAIGAVLGAAGHWLYDARLWPAIWLVALSLLPSALITVAESVLFAQERMQVVAAVNIAEVALRVALMAAAVLAGTSLTALFAGLCAARVVAAGLYLLQPDLGSHLRLSGATGATVRHLLRLCPVFLASMLLVAGILRIDFILLSTLASLTQVADYARPYKLYEAALTLPTVLTVVVFPIVSRLYDPGGRGLDTVVSVMSRFLACVGLPLAVLLGWLAPWLVGALFGAEHAPAAIVLTVLAAAPVLAALDQVLSTVLIVSHRQDRDLGVLLFTFSFYVVALALLIPARGVLGAAVATLLTMVVQFATRLFAVRDQVAVGRLLAGLSRPLLAAAVMLGLLLLAGDRPPVLAAGLAILGYLGVLFATRAVTIDDLRRLRAALGPGGRA